MTDIKFISYDGKFPNLCRGMLVIMIDGITYAMFDLRNDHKRSCVLNNPNIIKVTNAYLYSGGNTSYDYDYEESITEGPWSVDLSEAKTTDGIRLFRSKEIQRAIEDCVNDNIPWGCCGGCI